MSLILAHLDSQNDTTSMRVVGKSEYVRSSRCQLYMLANGLMTRGTI